MYTYRSTHTITVQTNHHNIIIHHLKMQVYTTNKTSGLIYILKKHPQHSSPIKWCSVFFSFKWNSIPFSKKGSWLIFRWIPPRSPPRHLDHRASVLHIVQLAARVHPSDRWFEGGLVDGKGWDGRWCFSRICRWFGCLLEIWFLEKCTSWCGRKSATLVIIVPLDRTSRSAWISRTIIIFTYKKKNAAVFVQGTKKGAHFWVELQQRLCF